MKYRFGNLGEVAEVSLRPTVLSSLEHHPRITRIRANFRADFGRKKAQKSQRAQSYFGAFCAFLRLSELPG
jgi:hypothetical protein